MILFNLYKFYFVPIISGVIFMLLFPILDLGCFYLAVGRNPANLPIGIVNNEVDQWHNCYSQNLITVSNLNDTCNFHQISCRFIHELDRTNDLKSVSQIILL